MSLTEDHSSGSEGTPYEYVWEGMIGGGGGEVEDSSGETNVELACLYMNWRRESSDGEGARDGDLEWWPDKGNDPVIGEGVVEEAGERSATSTGGVGRYSSGGMEDAEEAEEEAETCLVRAR